MRLSLSISPILLLVLLLWHTLTQPWLFWHSVSTTPTVITPYAQTSFMSSLSTDSLNPRLTPLWQENRLKNLVVGGYGPLSSNITQINEVRLSGFRGSDSMAPWAGMSRQCCFHLFSLLWQGIVYKAEEDESPMAISMHHFWRIAPPGAFLIMGIVIFAVIMLRHRVLLGPGTLVMAFIVCVYAGYKLTYSIPVKCPKCTGKAYARQTPEATSITNAQNADTWKRPDG